MTSIAELGIKVDSGDAAQAATELDKLAAAGGRAEKAAEGVASGFDKASTSAAGLSSAEDRLSETTEEAMARLTAMAKASLESSQYVQGLGGSVTSTASAMDGGKAAARDWSAEIAAINSRAQALLATEDRLAEESRKAAAATGVQAEGLQALLGKINPTIAALDRLDEQQAQLQKYKNAGLIDVETFSEYAGRIDSSRQKLGDLDESLQKTGRTTNQTQQALRQLPSQFTDIFTSLAGGQNPLLVLIQQGGQIADSFGGIGPTLDVMGQKIRSVLGLGGGIGAVGDALDTVGSGAKAAADGADAASDSLGGLAEGANTAADAAKNAKEATDALSTATPPLSSAFGLVVAGAVAVAAAIATVIYGYSQGSKEADRYNQALVLTGNRAGKTADQLASMAQQIAATNGTVGEAAASLVLIANSGTIASDSFKTVADAAAAMEDATGQAVEKTVAEFAKIGKDPVAAAKELNQQYGFLTAAVYSQIVALKEQGDTIGAAKLLTDTYANTMTERSGEITKNLGLWERGWKAVGDETKKSIDSLKEFGREQTLADKITNAQQRLAAAQSAVNGNPVDTDAQEKLTNSRLELQYLTQQRDTQAAIAAARGADAQRQQATILAMTKVDGLEKSARTNAEKRAEALKDYNKSLDAIRKTSPNDDRLKPDNIARVKSNIADQFKDPKQSAGAVDLTAFNDAQNQLKSITSYYDNTQKELDAAQKAGLVSADSYASQRVAIVQQEQVEVTAAYEAEISALEAARAKVSTSAEQRIQLDQKIADTRAAMVKAQQDADTELNVLATNEQGRLKKQELAVKTYTSALEQQVKTLREQGQRSAATLGLGDRQRGLFDQQNGIDDRINQQKVELANQYGDGSRGMSLDEYNQKLAALNKTQQDLRDTVQANYDDMTIAQGSWSAGASSAFQNYLDSAKDVAGQTKSLFTNAFSSMEDAVASFAVSGKFSFSDFTKSVIADMARIAARQAASGLLSSVMSWGISAWAGMSGGGNGLPAGSAGAVSSNLGASPAGYSAEYGFDEGGYTGNGGKYEPAGIVHGGEVVIRKEVVDQPGMKDFLVNLNKKGFADGGFVDSGMNTALAASRSSGSAGNTYNFPVAVSVQTSGDAGVADTQQASTDFGKGIQQAAKLEAETAISRALQPGGSIWRLTRGR
ncbi:phage tail tape measure protein [Pseudomonas sp. JDS28PS106]|uniref:phage tail tape measure protein n=1 Tax=Pseudomonas sp. JDS28PS106 TaxID=2497235 RepID=UPI002FCF696F